MISTARPIFSISPFTLLDYPDHTACILWFAGCNMRCGYCYNPDIVRGKGKITYEELLAFLQRRKQLLDGVVMSGGECTLHQDLPWLAEQVKSLGMKVKIDTNGSRPHVLENLLSEKLADYIALDFKALSVDFGKITKSDFFAQFKESLEVLLGFQVPFEVRTTVHSELISQKKLDEMLLFLDDCGYQGKYYIQHFVNESPSLEKLPDSIKSRYTFDFCTTNISYHLRN